MNPSKPIDIREVIRKKNPRLARTMPGFLIRIIERLGHLEEVNKVLAMHPEGPAIAIVRDTLREMEVTWTAHHFDKIPQDGRYVFVSNHPLGGLDGLILMDLLSTRFPEFRFVVTDILMNLTPLQELFLPVNKFGRQKQQYVTRIEEAFESDAQIIFFPAGICSRRTGGGISDPPWSRTFLTKAVQYRRDVVPIHFFGQNSAFFYWAANMRKALGIKTSYETFLLSDEMFRQKGKQLSLVFGDPISWQSFDASKTDWEWVEFVRSKVYELS